MIGGVQHVKILWPLWRSGVPQGKVANLGPNWCALGWDSEQKPAASRIVLHPVRPWLSTAASAVAKGDWSLECVGSEGSVRAVGSVLLGVWVCGLCCWAYLSSPWQYQTRCLPLN